MKVGDEFRLILPDPEQRKVKTSSCCLHVWPKACKHVNTRSGGSDDEAAQAPVIREERRRRDHTSDQTWSLLVRGNTASARQVVAPDAR